MIYLKEEIKNYSLSFKYNNQNVNFESSKAINLYIDLVNWLYKNEYTFSGEVHNNFIRKTFTLDEVTEILKSHPSYKSRGLNGVFFKIDGSDKYMYRGGNIDKIYPNIIKMLVNFGIPESLILTDGLYQSQTRIKKLDEIDIEENDFDFSNKQVKPFGKLPQPFDVESELTRAQAQSEEDVLSFKSFRATEPNERPDELMIFNSYVKNPFGQAICVLGESGAGKSTTIDNILKKSGHIYQYIIPAASTTGLLSQFSPSAGAAGGYIPSRLGQMIEKAYNNKDVNYTAVFDECHKTNIIEMINDELLQAISKNRNKGVRFISLDDDTRKLYPSAKEDSRGNVLIPDNFGFIFISSNVRVISGNPDFFNRVDLIELTVEDRKLQSIEDLNQKRVTITIDKKELVSKILTGRE